MGVSWKFLKWFLQRPLLYNIEQPFFAVPLSGSPRNYTFAVYCTIPAYYNVNVTTNTSDE